MIHRRLYGFVLLAGLFLSLLAGCGKSAAPSAPAPEPSALTPQPVTSALRLHWLGKKRLATESNATNFMALWNLPESSALEAQTLDKLASAPWRLWATNVSLSNAPSAQLRPLLDDLVQEESYLEVVATTNQPLELVLALHLPADHLVLWQTNLSTVLLSLFPGAQRSAPGSDFWLQTPGFRLDLSRSNDWTLLSLTRSQPATPNPQPSRLLATFQQRLAKAQTPFVPPVTNYWLEASFDLVAISKAFDFSSPAFGLDRISLNLLGDGVNMRTHGDLFFSKPLPIEINAWNIPTNLISDQLISFTAARLPDVPSFKSFFHADLAECLELHQVFIWALRSLPMATYAAVPITDGSDCFTHVSQWLLGEANAWISTNSVGAFTKVDDEREIVWRGTPILSAYAQAVDSADGSYVLVGLVPTVLTNSAPNLELANRMMQRTNLVYYDWEFTGPRVESGFYIGQMGRVLSGRQQLSQDFRGVTWLKAIAPRLGNAGTVAELPEPQHLSLDRFAVLGLTAFELHIFVDWLESATFPLGTYSTTSPPRPLSKRKPGATIGN